MSVIIGIFVVLIISGVVIYFYKKYEKNINAKAATLKTDAENTANTAKTDIKNHVDKW